MMYLSSFITWWHGWHGVWFERTIGALMMLVAEIAIVALLVLLLPCKPEEDDYDGD
jgi:hypothetical protein